MHFTHTLVFLLVLVKVTVCKEVLEGESEPTVEPRQLRLGGRQLVNFRDTSLAQMIMTPLEGARKMAAQTTWGLLKTLDPDGRRAGPARVRRPGPRPQRQGQRGGQRPRGGPQQGRIAITQEEYDYLNNFDYDEDDYNFDYYDYSADGETKNGFLIEPIPVRNSNNNRNRNKNNFGNPRERPIRQKITNIPGPKQFNRPQIINDLIQRSGFDGPFYPYKTYVGKSLFKK